MDALQQIKDEQEKKVDDKLEHFKERLGKLIQELKPGITKLLTQGVNNYVQLTKEQNKEVEDIRYYIITNKRYLKRRSLLTGVHARYQHSSPIEDTKTGCVYLERHGQGIIFGHIEVIGMNFKYFYLFFPWSICELSDIEKLEVVRQFVWQRLVAKLSLYDSVEKCVAKNSSFSLTYLLDRYLVDSESRLDYARIGLYRKKWPLIGYSNSLKIIDVDKLSQPLLENGEPVQEEGETNQE